MRTSTLVQATADVVTIVNLRRGDVYKRLETNTYGEKHTLQFGVVTDVMHNGTDAVIVAMEFPQDWSGAPTPKLRTFGSDTELALFAAQPEEVQEHFASVLDGSGRTLDAAREAWRKAQATDTQVRAIVGRFAGAELTAARTGTPELPAAEAELDELL